MQKLCNIPSAWRSQIADVLCDANKGLDIPQETLTKLGDWNINYSPEICIAYTDEEGVTVNRCFDFSHLLNQQMDLLNPRCVATSEAWQAMDYLQKLQAMLDKLCTACFTETTFPSGSTTTTTTIAPSDVIGRVYFGAKATNDVSQADVAATTEVMVDPAFPINFNWTSFNSAPKYLWFALPSNKTQWQDLVVSFNHGNIGTVDDLFGPPTTITVNGVSLYLYVTMYSTQVDNILQIS